MKKLSTEDSALELEFNSLKSDSDKPISELLKELEQLVKKADEASEFKLQCRILTYLGRAYRLRTDAYKSINSLNKAYIVFNTHIVSDKYILTGIYRELGNVYANSLEDYLTSIDYNFKGYNLNNDELNATFLNNIGSNYMSLKQYDNAIKYFKKGISLAKNRKEIDLIELAYLYHNYGEVNLYLENYEDALKYLEIAQNYCTKFIATAHDPINISNGNHIYAFSNNIKAEVYFKQNLMSHAREVLAHAKEFSMRNQQFQPLGNMYILEGKMLLAEGKIDEYNKLFEESIKFCDEKSLPFSKQLLLENKLELLEAKNDFKNAFYLSKRLTANQEEIKSKHKKFNISQILVNKEQEILELENRNRIMQLQKDELKQFAYIVTHDLKTPLSNIYNFSGLFIKKYNDKVDEKGKEYLEYIMESANRLTSMLSDLMQYISFEKANDEDFEFCNPYEVFETAIKKNQLSPNEYELIGGEVNTVPIRAFHLEILIDNLIRNSIKFKREDIPLHLNFSCTKSDNEFLFEFMDNGIGIEDQYKNQIFEIFKRLNKNDSSGTGIGLSIGKKIIQNYKGEIWVEDNEGPGCNFKFTIASPLS